MKSFFLILFLSVVFISCKDDNNLRENGDEKVFEYIGLKDEANVIEAQEKVRNTYGRSYKQPSVQVLDGYIYIATWSGIYRKPTKSLNKMDWKKFAFFGLPVIQFVIKGDSIIAITACTDERAFVLSTDGGKTYEAITPPEFIMEENEFKVIPYSISQNSQNANSLLALVEPIGVVKSVDFGKTWKVIGTFYGGYQDWFVGFHPQDTTNIYNTGTTMISESFINASYNDGKDWEVLDNERNNCINHIAFDPTDPNKMIYSGRCFLKKTVDKGRNWNPVLKDDMFFHKTIYDKRNSRIVYATGATCSSPESHEITIHHSIDGGDTWSILYQAKLFGVGGIVNIEQYDVF
ncbi:sialidase family protein [Bacteroides pyogenes]|uniref:sialidase family protein n=1 Tax=Bacteroides pyogenes TaxID=310300 RepID=UPI001F44685B|nr:hypothetical protein [Bacteroides pyogenes]MCF2707869.1 hypothetical protein [Bacteroides pyogenes]